MSSLLPTNHTYAAGTFDRSLSLIIDGALIKQVSSTKSLGTHIDETLSWNVDTDIL